MKVVKLSHPNYEYDVHSLVKAFYAEDQVTVITPETKPEKLAELEPQVSLEIELAETGAKIRVGEEDFLWDAETANLADGYKNGLKRFLYRTLSKVTGQELPWGNLTGIRPTKIAYGMLDEGRSDSGFHGAEPLRQRREGTFGNRYCEERAGSVKRDSL